MPLKKQKPIYPTKPERPMIKKLPNILGPKKPARKPTKKGM
jgi:hypothetical protein